MERTVFNSFNVSVTLMKLSIFESKNGPDKT
jgi:hypothetical protein